MDALTMYSRDPMGGDTWEPKGPHGRDPMGGTLGSDPWEPKGSHGRGTVGSPRNPVGGDPREPKGSHGKDPWEPKGSHGRGPSGAQGISWEGTLGSPRTTEDQFGGNWGLQEPFWRYSVTK